MDRLRIAAVAAALAALAAAGTGAQTPGAGIPKISFAPAEVGTRIFKFTGLTERVPKAMMFQGYLVIFSNRCKRTDTYDLANPRAPRLVKTFTFGGSGDDHTTPTAGTRIMDGGTLLDFADPANPRVVGTNAGFYGSVWPAFQWPYFYSTRSYDDASARSSPMYIVDYSAGGRGVRVKEVGVQGMLGFTTGSTHVVGNLLIVTSGDQYAGVSTWDLSDPVNPKLLDAVKTGPSMYTSQMYGRHVVTTGPQNEGEVGFFDISDPTAIALSWREDIPNMGDYAGFQNGFLFGSTINGGRFIKYDIAARRTVLTGTIPNRSTSRYCFPMGNMLWIGDAGRDGVNGSDNQSDLFAHQQNPDSLHPVVLYTNPANGEPRQAVTSRIGIAFDEEMDNRTLTTANVIVRPKGGQAIQGTYGCSMGVVNFTPSAPLLPNMTYEVVIPAGSVKDWTGNPILVEYGFRFSTAPTVDGGPWLNQPPSSHPGVVSTAPPAVWKPRTRLVGEQRGEGSLLLRLHGDRPRGLAPQGRLTLADLNGRVVLSRRVETGALDQGLLLRPDGRDRVGKGMYRLLLEAGPVRLQGAVFLARGL